MLNNRRKEAAIALFVVALVLLNFPLIQLPAAQLGHYLPGIGIYLLLVWVGLIVALWGLFRAPDSSSR